MMETFRLKKVSIVLIGKFLRGTQIGSKRLYNTGIR